MKELKPMNQASKQEFDDLTHLMTLKSKITSSELDTLQGLWNTFVSHSKICRSCSAQLHSIMGILKLRYNEHKEMLYNKYYNKTPKCERCGTEYVKKYHYDNYCSICAPIVKEEKKYKKRPVIDDDLTDSKIDDEQGF